MKDSILKYVALAILLAGLSTFLIVKLHEGFVIGEDGFEICSTLSDCGTCARAFGCTWCDKDAVCVSDNSANAVCPAQSKIKSPDGCNRSGRTDNSGGLVSPGNMTCSASTNCNTCLSIPGCYWCNTQKLCSSNMDVYQKCGTDMQIFRSFSQCSLVNSPVAAQPPAGTSGAGAAPFSGIVLPSTVGAASTPSEVSNSSSIIPILGLSRNSDGSLTNASIQSVMQSLQSQGYSITNRTSRATLMNVIKAEIDSVKAQKKANMSVYVANSADYVSDGASLARIKAYDTQLLDLHDISRHIERVSFEGFQEGFALNLEVLESANEYNRQSLKTSGLNIQLIYFANFVAIGTILYFVNR